MRNRFASLALSAILFSSGIFVVISLLFAVLLPESGSLSGRLGLFLFSRFSWAAFYLPLYLFTTGGLTLVRPFSPSGVVGASLAVIPFLTVSILLKTVLTPSSAEMTRFLNDFLGSGLTILLFGLLTVLEGFFIYRYTPVIVDAIRGEAKRNGTDSPVEKDSIQESEEADSDLDLSLFTPTVLRNKQKEQDEIYEPDLIPFTGNPNVNDSSLLKTRSVKAVPPVPKTQPVENPSSIPEPVPVEAIASFTENPSVEEVSSPSEPGPVGEAPAILERDLTEQIHSGSVEEDLEKEARELENLYVEQVISRNNELLEKVLDEPGEETESLEGYTEIEEDPGLAFISGIEETEIELDTAQEDLSELQSPRIMSPEPLISPVREEDDPVDEQSESGEQTESPAVEYFHESFDDEEEGEDEEDEVEPILSPQIPALDEAAEVPMIAPEDYHVPISGVLDEYPGEKFSKIDDATRKAAEVLKKTLEEFKIEAEVTGIRKGPVITMFEILPAPGIKISRIVNLADNIALRLAASRVRIVAPIPGKHAVGIEVPNRKRSLVSFSEMLETSKEALDKGDMNIPIILGKDISGETQIVDLTKTPHMLIAGATGSGKSVCVNSLICSLLYTKAPSEVKLIMVDPKIVELKFYNDIPHLLTPVITEPKKALQAIQYCLFEMERRYALLDALGVRDIKSYNKKIKKKNIATLPLPYIVLVIDEFADLMAVSGKELEGVLARLAAMSRAVGIHLVLATQRPSIDVITGLIKANFPSRIAFMVASKFDSRIILDSVGAEKLLGKGDMLFTSSWDPFPQRMQGAFLSEHEVEKVVEYVKTLGKPDYIDDEIFIDDDDEAGGGLFTSDSDPLMEKAIEIVCSAGKASASYLQRRLKIGYNRAARLVEDMEDRGIVGPQNGSKPRDILRKPEM